MASGMETSQKGNYRSSTTRMHYRGESGGWKKKVADGCCREILTIFNTTSPAFIPATLALGQVRYVMNPLGGENVLTSYPDTEYDTEFGLGSLAGATVKTIASISPVAGISGALYKWVRINPITEKSINQDVNGDHVQDAATPLFFDGQHLNLNSTGQQALEVTSLAVLPDGTQKTLQYVVAPLQLSA